MVIVIFVKKLKKNSNTSQSWHMCAVMEYVAIKEIALSDSVTVSQKPYPSRGKLRC